MFGKLSLWAANTYHGPSVPKLDIQRAKQRDLPATHTDEPFDNEYCDWLVEYADPFDNITSTASAGFCPFDIDINLLIMAKWSDEQKAEFIIANRAILKSHRYLFTALGDVRLDSVQDIVYQMCDPGDFQHIMQRIYRVKFISAYLQANHGTVSENLEAWLCEKYHSTRGMSAADVEEYLLSVWGGNIIYIMKYGYHPVIIPDDPERIHQILLNLKTKPEVLELVRPYMHLPLGVDPVDKYCKSIEETHAMLCEDKDSEIKYIALMTYTAAQFCEFAAIYKGGVPSAMHTRWIEYAYRLPRHMQNVDHFIVHANRKIKPKDHGALYKYLWTNRALLDEVVKCVECRQGSGRYLNAKYGTD